MSKSEVIIIVTAIILNALWLFAPASSQSSANSVGTFQVACGVQGPYNQCTEINTVTGAEIRTWQTFAK